MTHKLSAGKLAELIRQNSMSTFHSMDPDEWKRIIQLRDEDGRSLIHTAAACGLLEIVQAMLAHGFRGLVNEEDEEGWTPLMSACSSGHEPVVQCLIASGANPLSSNNSGRTALHYAASKGHVRIAQMLLEEGAYSNILAGGFIARTFP
jgi:26S proteasome non-ATPase regulatory subunit 10